MFHSVLIDNYRLGPFLIGNEFFSPSCSPFQVVYNMMSHNRREAIKQTTAYRMVKLIALWMDQRFLDPIIGVLLPSVGDVLTSFFSLPYLYLSMVKIKSIPLTLAIIYNMLLDILIGLIPFVGVVGDIFKRAFARNALLIEGYVEGRQAVIREVERKAVWMALLIVLFFFLIYWMIVSVVKLSEWIISFF